MRCILCGKIIDKEIKISTFFKFDYYCDDCERIIEPKYTIFPLREGYIGKYYYLYENKRDNYKVYRTLYKVLDTFIEINKNRIIIFLDKNIINNLDLILFKENIIFFSEEYLYIENELSE